MGEALLLTEQQMKVTSLINLPTPFLRISSASSLHYLNHTGIYRERRCELILGIAPPSVPNVLVLEIGDGELATHTHASLGRVWLPLPSPASAEMVRPRAKAIAVCVRLAWPAVSLVCGPRRPQAPAQTVCVVHSGQRRPRELEDQPPCSCHTQQPAWAVETGTPTLGSQLFRFPSCVTLANPGTSLGLHFLLRKWVNRAVVRLQWVTCTTGLLAQVPPPCRSLSPSLMASFLPSSPGSIRPEEAESPSSSVFLQKKIPPGLHRVCCFSLPLVCICLSGNESGKQMPCSRADVMRLGGASRWLGKAAGRRAERERRRAAVIRGGRPTWQ